jgi:hypothetical protein
MLVPSFVVMVLTVPSVLRCEITDFSGDVIWPVTAALPMETMLDARGLGELNHVNKCEFLLKVV